jgi:hypothetical protein
MDVRRLRVGEWIVALSGAVLLVSLWLPWWSLPDVEGAYSDAAPELAWSAWQALSTTDVLLALLGATAIVVALIVARATAAGPGVAAEAFLTPFALALAIACLVRVLDVPAGLEPPVRVGDAPGARASVDYGAWIGLAATFGVLLGTLVAMRDERLSRPGRLTDQTGAPVDRPVEVETLPAPPPA